MEEPEQHQQPPDGAAPPPTEAPRVTYDPAARPARVTRPALAERPDGQCCEHSRAWPHHAEGIGCLHEGCPCPSRLPPRAAPPLPGAVTEHPRPEFL